MGLVLIPWIFLVLYPLVQSTERLENITSVSTENRLIRELLARYDVIGTIARPITDSSKLIKVRFGLRLVHLDLDEKEQTMTTSVWIRTKWYDHNLKWNRTLYDGIRYVVLPVDKIWTPDVALVNTAITTVTEQSAQALIKYTGLVFWAPQRKYSSACLIDVTEYPYDRHTCDMWFQCIANPGTHVNITPYDNSPVDMETYLTSYKHAQEWEILANSSTRHERPRDVGMVLMWSRRPALQFNLTVQRRPGFKGILLIVPCTLLSFLIPLIFCLPPERPDRHTLAMSLYGSLTILLFMVNEVAPSSTSFVCRLALYYCFNLLVLLLATCCSAIVVNLHRRGETRSRVPRIVRKVFIQQLGRLLCFSKRLNHLNDVENVSQARTPRHALGLPAPMPSLTADEGIALPRQSASFHSYLGQAGVQTTSSSRTKVVRTESWNGPLLSPRADTGYNLSCTVDESKFVERVTSGEASPELIATPLSLRVEWQTLAMILDRFFFLWFLWVDLVSLGIFYPRRR